MVGDGGGSGERTWHSAPRSDGRAGGRAGRGLGLESGWNLAAPQWWWINSGGGEAATPITPSEPLVYCRCTRTRMKDENQEEDIDEADEEEEDQEENEDKKRTMKRTR